MKIKSDNLFMDVGIDTTAAIRIFLTQAVDYNGFPSDIYKIVPTLNGKITDIKKSILREQALLIMTVLFFWKSPSKKCITNTKTPLEKCDIRAKSP